MDMHDVHRHGAGQWGAAAAPTFGVVRMPHVDASDHHVELGNARHSRWCFSQASHAIASLRRELHLARHHVPATLDGVVEMARLILVAPGNIQLAIVFGANDEILFVFGELTKEPVGVCFPIHDVDAAAFLQSSTARFDEFAPPVEFAIAAPILLPIRVGDRIAGAKNGNHSGYSEWRACFTRSDERHVGVEALRSMLARPLHPTKSLPASLSAEAETRCVVDHQDPSRLSSSPCRLAEMRRE